MFKFLLLLCAWSFGALALTIVPFERDWPRVSEYYYIGSRNIDSDIFTTQYGFDKNEQIFWRGFSLMNMGPNQIVPTKPQDVDFANRDYLFISDDRSRRDTYLWITDYSGHGRTADYFETILFFLPRENQMHAEDLGDQVVVTLTTGEEVVFDAKTKMIKQGVLKELPLDLNPDRVTRKHVQLKYSGKGIIIRSDTKGADPRLAASVQILKNGLNPCKLPGSTFWTQEGFPKFKFTQDEDAYTIIRQKCGEQYLP
jgi:hypothetical protein